MKKIKLIFTIFFIFMLIISPFLNTIADENPLNSFKQVKDGGGYNENSSDGVKVGKNITRNDLENYFDITLEVQTKSKALPQDLAVVVVLDISNTMYSPITGDETQKRKITAAQEASEQFIKDFATSASDAEGATRKIGFVEFNTNAELVFGLQDCDNDAKAEQLSTTMKNKTNENFANATVYASYKASHNRFTNIEAGLKMANDLLNDSGISNKYIVFISDGFPTTYVKNGYTGYDPYTPKATSSGNGNFFDKVLGRPCKYGTSYSDEAAIKARTIAETIKTSGTKIYSIGVDLEGQTIQQYIDQTAGSNYDYSVVDRTGKTYEIGAPNNSQDYKNWLKNSIGSGSYSDVTNSEEFTSALQEIFKKIKFISEASWVSEDPMNVSENTKDIGFVGIYNDAKTALSDSVTLEANVNSNTAYYDIEKDKINWDLKKSNPEELTIGDTTYYLYKLTYRIRLTNEKDNFSEGVIYKTNGITTLDYVVKQNSAESEIKRIEFPIPSVEGYLTDFTFNKVSSLYNIGIPGAKFELKHDPNCICQSERRHMDENIKYYATSTGSGLVTFNNIPSGHTYILKEIEAPINHNINTTEYEVEVSYDEITIKDYNETNLNIVNNIKTGNLKILKEVDGLSTNQEFKFKIHVTYNNENLKGTYQLTLKDGSNITKTFDENGDIEINLKDKDTITVNDLPTNAIYTITELNSDGYYVEYCTIGDNNTCTLKEGKEIQNGVIGEANTVSVKFVNYASVIMPETGGCGTTIMVITGSILMIGSVIYIYQDFKNKKVSN